MQEKYQVMEIYERDYGCEEREDDQKDIVLVRLRSENGQEHVVEAEDAALYRQEIMEGTEVFLVDGKDIFSCHSCDMYFMTDSRS